MSDEWMAGRETVWTGGEERSDVRALITMDATVVRVSGAGVSVKAVALYANVTVGSCWV